MEIYKLWLSEYEGKTNTTIFTNLNPDEVLGILKIWYIVKPTIKDFIFTINKTSSSISQSNTYSNYYRDILPYSNNRDIKFYMDKYNLNNKIYLVINIPLLNNLEKEYLLLLENINQLYGCILAIQMFLSNVNISISEIGNINYGKIDKMKTPKISFESRIVENV
jgi:hypothetical protein